MSMPTDRGSRSVSVEQERRQRKQRLAASFRLFAYYGFDDGVAGHITVRDPELLDHFWVNPLGRGFRQMRVRDLLLVDDEGRIVQGHGRLNAAAFAIHSQIHASRPDVNAAAHAHSTYGKAWSTFRRPLEPITQDACAFYQDHAVFDDYTGAVFELSEGKRIAHSLAGHKAVILANHGLLTVGQSVDEAVYWFIKLERACQTQLLVESAGTPIPIDADQAAKAAAQTGTSSMGKYASRPLFEWIVSEQPDLLDEE